MNTNSTPLIGTIAGPLRAGAGRLAKQAADLVVRWNRRSEDRRYLSQMSDRMLLDIGVTRGDLDREVNKPIWRR